jgi:hypothetical protein
MIHTNLIEATNTYVHKFINYIEIHGTGKDVSKISRDLDSEGKSIFYE